MANKVLAKVNGKEITEQDKQFLLQQLGPQRAAQFQGEQGDQMLLNELINQELFYFDALDSNIDETERFKAELEKAKENILKQLNIQNTLNTVDVTEEQAKEHYEANAEKYDKPPRAKAYHILVDEEDKAEEIAEEIKDGLDFEEAAKQYSSCPSKEKGGDLGFFEKGKMVPEFEEVAFDIDLNELSDPVKTQFGYHLIKVTDREEGSSSSYDEVKDQIIQELTVKAQNELYLGKVKELKDKYDVEIVE